MNVSSVFLSVLCNLLVVSILTVHGQPAEQTRTFKFQLLCLDQTIRELKYQNGGEVVDVTVPNASFSKVYDYTGDPSLDFFIEKPLSDGSVNRIQVESLNIPESASNSTLLFLIDVKVGEKDPLVFSVFSKDLQLSRPNSLVVINKAEQPIRVIAGSEDFKLPSGKIDIAPITLDANNRFELTVYKLFEKKAVKAYLSSLRMNPDHSMFLFVYPDEQNPRRLKAYSVSYLDPDSARALDAETAAKLPPKKRQTELVELSERQAELIDMDDTEE
ncbi:MAG: hypothetical protein CNE95_00565 [Puniceicoccaceae bacterium MED-G30]|jgi:hypothetical protein|nr:MAG: hypothetical protein CNE95_00565 [Puniceicoccaceae bacterium MED-G30]RPG83683.1 MAG: hypothetical protein CBC33_008375 [Coraliomargarita sp. TMED73]|tara:strand:- start:7559 stop:8377 length:819 start_codon:yes stop_codon:yes gene_type:complete